MTMTYAAADLTQGYRANKVREVTRQFLYWRGQRDYFVIFDRVEATDAVSQDVVSAYSLRTTD